MNRRKLVIISAVALGLLSGSSALTPAEAAQRPIDWNDILFLLMGSVIGMLFVLGVQIVRRNPKPALIMIRIFEPISAYVLGAGLSAFVLSLVKNGIQPSGVFVAAVGIGLITGVALASVLFRVRYRNVLYK